MISRQGYLKTVTFESADNFVVSKRYTPKPKEIQKNSFWIARIAALSMVYPAGAGNLRKLDKKAEMCLSL